MSLLTLIRPFLLVGALVPAITLAPPSVGSQGLTTPTPVTLVTTAITGAFAGIWTGVEGGYFAEEGVDLQLVTVADSSRAIPLLFTKEAQFATLDGQVVIQANASGADLRAVASITNHFVFSIVAASDIQSPQDLRGKRLGISGPGSANDTAARQQLARWNLSPGSDVALVPTGGMPGVLAGLVANQLEAGIVSPPTSVIARRAGYHELIDLAKDGPEWPSVTFSTTRAMITDNPAVVAAMVRAYARGINRFKTDQEFGKQVLRKYLQLEEESLLDETWVLFRDNFDDIPHVTPVGLQSAIDSVATTLPDIDRSPDAYVDDSFVKRLEGA
jgi:NitT/TauT family transport system substrate-binding protein